MAINVSPKKIALILAGVTLLLIVGHIAGQVVRLNFGPQTLAGWVRVLDMDGEGSIPTWFSSVLLLLCSAMLAIISSTKKKSSDRYATHWRFLSIGFLLMSVDEVAQFHEAIGAKLQLALDTSGFLFFAWIIPATAFIAILALAYRGFLSNLPPMTRRLFVIAGVTYVGGAVGLEMLEGKFLGWSATWPAGWILITTVQETLEIAGLILFIYALLAYVELRAEKNFQMSVELETEESKAI